MRDIDEMNNNMKLNCISRQEHKFICSVSYKDIALFHSKGMLSYNLEPTNIKKDSFKNKIVKRIGIDNENVKTIEESIANNELRRSKLLLNIRSENTSMFMYNELDRILSIACNHTDIGNEIFVDVVSGYEEIVAINNVYQFNPLIGSRIIDAEVFYNLSSNEIKQMTS